MRQQIFFINQKFLSKWDEIEKLLYIESDLLAEGTYVGMDGVRTFYPGDVLDEANPTIIGKPIKLTHGDGAETVIGFWTKVQGNGKTHVAGYVFNPEGIDFLKAHPNWGLSMEGDAISEFDNKKKCERANKLVYTAGSVVEHPAFGGRIESTREIRLEKGENEKLENDEMFVEFKENAKPTRGAFFDWLEKTLKDKGVAEEEILKVITILKSAIKSPYPYPYPAPGGSKMGSPVDSVADALDIKSAELGEFQDFMKTCLKEKDMKACVADWKAKHKEQSTPEHDSVVATLKLKLEKAEAAIDERLNEDIVALVDEIHRIDSGFDPKSMEAPDKLGTKKLLSTYLASLKRISGDSINIKLGSSADDEAKKERRKKLAAEMFGESELMRHIEVK